MAKTKEDPLQNWEVLNRTVKDLTEEECAEVLKREKKGKKRLQFMLRLYGRYNTLRTQRDRKEIAALCE